MLDRLEQIKSEYRQKAEERAVHKIQELNHKSICMIFPGLFPYPLIPGKIEANETNNVISILRDYVNSLVSRDVIYHLQTKGY